MNDEQIKAEMEKIMGQIADLGQMISERADEAHGPTDEDQEMMAALAQAQAAIEAVLPG